MDAATDGAGVRGALDAAGALTVGGACKLDAEPFLGRSMLTVFVASACCASS
jgi:hypothetical protein